MDDITFFECGPGSVFLGSDKGSQMYVQEQPRHEVIIKSQFKISECITKAQWAKIMSSDNQEEFESEKYQQPADGIGANDIDTFLMKLNEEFSDSKGGIFRLPSEAEWELAHSTLGEKFVIPTQGEILGDSPFPNYWGAPCDGRPRIDTSMSQESHFKITKKPHIIKNKKPVRGVIRTDQGQEDVGFRIVWRSTKIEKQDWLNLPNEPEKMPILKRELLFFLILGALPSLLIAGYNNIDYLKESFMSVLFGGFFFSLMTAFIWRPKRPTWIVDVENHEMIQK